MMIGIVAGGKFTTGGEIFPEFLSGIFPLSLPRKPRLPAIPENRDIGPHNTNFIRRRLTRALRFPYFASAPFPRPRASAVLPCTVCSSSAVLRKRIVVQNSHTPLCVPAPRTGVESSVPAFGRGGIPVSRTLFHTFSSVAPVRPVSHARPLLPAAATAHDVPFISPYQQHHTPRQQRRQFIQEYPLCLLPSSGH